jgi:hypothetical protein
MRTESIVAEYRDKVSGRILYKRQDFHKDKVVNYYFSDPELKILHREDGPAIEDEGNSLLWFYNNRIHRMNGPAYTGDFRNGIPTLWHWGVDQVLLFSIDSDGIITKRLN